MSLVDVLSQLPLHEVRSLLWDRLGHCSGDQAALAASCRWFSDLLPELVTHLDIRAPSADDWAKYRELEPHVLEAAVRLCKRFQQLQSLTFRDFHIYYEHPLSKTLLYCLTAAPQLKVRKNSFSR